MASDPNRPRRVGKILLVVVGNAIGALCGLLLLLQVFVDEGGVAIHRPLFRVVTTPAVVAIVALVVTLCWLIWECGGRDALLGRGKPHATSANAYILRASLIGFLATCITGGAGLSLVPTHEETPSNVVRLVPVVQPKEPPPKVSFVVFFANGSSVIPPDQRASLRNFLGVLRQCNGLTLSMMGFVSSAPYPSDDAARNGKLLQDRVDSVTKVATSMGFKKPDNRPWMSPDEMFVARGFADKSGEKRLIEREPFNRRVEIHVSNYGVCAEAVKESINKAVSVSAPTSK